MKLKSLVYLFNTQVIFLVMIYFSQVKTLILFEQSLINKLCSEVHKIHIVLFNISC